MRPRCTANSEKSSQSSGSSINPRPMSALLTKPWVPSTARQTMVRAATLRKNGTVRSASVIARIGAGLGALGQPEGEGERNQQLDRRHRRGNAERPERYRPSGPTRKD